MGLARPACRICEKRLCETVDKETVGTTLALAQQVKPSSKPSNAHALRTHRSGTRSTLPVPSSHVPSIHAQNHAHELKAVCLDFISRNLAAVMQTEGYT